MTAGEFIKEFRKKNNLRAVDLADKLLCSQVFITNIENGKRKIPATTIEQLGQIMDKESYAQLLKLVDLEKAPESLKEEFLQLKQIKNVNQKKIPFYPDIQASAGYGCFNDYGTLEYIEVPEDLAKTGNIAIRVAGDSMEPEIKDGDIVIVDTKNIDCILNKIIVVNYQGAVYLKKFIQDEGDIFLKSINPYYPKIKIMDKSELRVIGRLRSVMRYY